MKNMRNPAQHFVFVLLTAGLCAIAALLTSCATKAQDAKFTWQMSQDRLAISFNGRPFADYVFTDTNTLRPYFCSVHTPDGIQVTRTHPPVAGVDAVDHPTMHPGIWIAFGDISGQDFWRNKATIRHERFVEVPANRGSRMTFATESTLLTTNSEALANLTCRCTLEPCQGGILLIWEAAFKPLVDGFVFGDQEEMGFGVRVATAMTEKNGGRVLNSDGVEGAKLAWGKTADWCDYSGTSDGRTVGMTVMPDPHNFRRSWFHSRDYGLLVANPFGRLAFTKEDRSAVPVAKGETFRLRCGVFVHTTGAGETVDIPAAYRQFTSE